MARYKNGINGPVSGKVGTIVGASWRGIDYVRNVADTSKVKWSEAQLNQRAIFALVMNWIKPLLPVINMGYQSFKSRKTPLNAAVGYHIRHAVSGAAPDYEIDFEKAIFSVGDLLISWVRQLNTLDAAILHLCWDNSTESIYSSGSDCATFVVYNPLRQLFVSFVNEATRLEREVRLQLPLHFKDDRVHVYVFYTNSTGDRVSTSQYIGQVIIN